MTLSAYNVNGVISMKRRGFFVAGAAGLAIFAVAGLQNSALDSFAQTLNGAKGLDVNYTMTVVGGKTSQYKVSLAKPNKARIETPEMTIVADGETITRYFKDDGVYYKKPQSDKALLSLFDVQSLKMWAPFFDEKTVTAYANAKDAGSRKRGNVNYKIVNATAGERDSTKITFFIDPTDYLAKQAQFDDNANGRSMTTVMNATKASLTTPKDDMFVFNAPADSKEVQEADLIAGKWAASFDEALTAAKVGDKLVLVDFMADWCGPCKMMEAEVFSTSEFKELTKNMVLVKVDVDRETGIASKYGITAMPTTKFVNSKGEVVHEFVGYGGFDHVMGEIKTAQQKFGK